MDLLAVILLNLLTIVLVKSIFRKINRVFISKGWTFPTFWVKNSTRQFRDYHCHCAARDACDDDYIQHDRMTEKNNSLTLWSATTKNCSGRIMRL